MLFRIHPKSKLKIRFDLIIILLSVYNAIVAPLEFAFPNLTFFAWLTVFNVCVDLAFLVDVFLTFRTSYYDDRIEEFITDNKAIAWNYMKGRFWVDVLASFPFDLLSIG